MSFFSWLFGKRKRESLMKDADYEADIHQKKTHMLGATTETDWTIDDYSVPQTFLQYYYKTFSQNADKLLKAGSIDEANPGFMDKEIQAFAEEAIAKLQRERPSHIDGVRYLIERKATVLASLEMEEEQVTKEYNRLKAIVDEIGGYDYV